MKTVIGLLMAFLLFACKSNPETDKLIMGISEKENKGNCIFNVGKVYTICGLKPSRELADIDPESVYKMYQESHVIKITGIKNGIVEYAYVDDTIGVRFYRSFYRFSELVNNCK